MGTLDRISQLLIERNIPQKELTDYLGVDKSTFSQWKKGTSQSYNKYLVRIAEFFKVSVDWLTGDTRFRTRQELIQCCNTWEIAGNESFDPAYDFCGLIKKLRESFGYSLEDLAAELSLSAEQYEMCEEGRDPISFGEAELLCECFNTSVKQVLFDHALYEPGYAIPDEYLDNIDEYEKIHEASEQLDREIENTSQDERRIQEKVHILFRHLKDSPVSERDKITKNFESTIDIYLKAMGLKEED